MNPTEQADLLCEEATAAVAIGELAQAAASYRAAATAAPAHFEAWHGLGLALLKLGLIKEAIGAGLMATTLRPNDLLAWTALSQMYVKAGQIPEAEGAKANARVLSLGGRIVRD